MNALRLWSHSLQFISHVYFERKEQFELKVDTYPKWVLFALEAGSYRYQIGQENNIAEPGDLLFCPPGTEFRREELSPMALHFITFDIPEVPVSAVCASMPSFKSHPADGKRLASNFAYLRKLSLASDPRSVYQKQWLINDLWQFACNEWDTNGYREQSNVFADSDDEMMNRAAEWLMSKAHTRFSMKEIADQLGLSPVQFTRRFQKAFHMPPSEFVRNMRIRKVVRLLLNTEFTLDQIAERCGYENGFYLSRVFSRSMGVSPSKYREQHRV